MGKTHRGNCLFQIRLAIGVFLFKKKGRSYRMNKKIKFIAMGVLSSLLIVLAYVFFPKKTEPTPNEIQSTQQSEVVNPILQEVPDAGIWISQSEIMSRPTSGAAWQAVLSDANASWGSANVANQDSNHDQFVLAGALVCARTGQQCDKTRAGLVSAIGTENGGRWLAIGRNVLGYTIAADVMKNSGNLTGTDLDRVSNWLAGFLTRTLANNNSGVQEKLTPFGSGSNASAQEGSVYAAIAAYTKDTTKLAYVWNRFRLYSCDRTGNPEQVIDISTGFNAGWSPETTYNRACAINPKGSVKDINPDPSVTDNINIDGAIINDMRRGGNFKFPPGYTSYPWVGLEGYIPAAFVLHRAGYPAFDISDKAVLRAVEYMCYLDKNTTTNWWDSSRAAEAKHLVKLMYGYNDPQCSIAYPTGGGRTFGFTDWTHPLGDISTPPTSPSTQTATLTGTPPASVPTNTPTRTVTLTLTRTPTVTASKTPSPTNTVTPTATAVPTIIVSSTPTRLSCQVGSKTVDIWVQLITVPESQTLRLRSDHIIPVPPVPSNVRGALYSDEGILFNVIEVWTDCNNYWGKLGEQMWIVLKFNQIYYSDWRE